MNARVPTEGILSFGYQRSATHVHRGIDLPRPEGTLVYASADGVVEHASDVWQQGFTGYGRCVVLRHARAWTLHAHLLSVAVTPGVRVLAGDTIGRVGKTQFSKADHHSELGPSSGPHLHFEVSPAKYPQQSEAARLDPRDWLAGAVDARTASAISTASRATGVDLALLRSVSFVASRWNPAASGPRVFGNGLALGLFGLATDAGLILGVSNPLNPEENARGAAAFLKSLLGRFASVELAIAAYVWDSTSVDRSPVVWPAPVDVFVRAVLAHLAVEQGEAIETRPLVSHQRGAVPR